MGSGRQEPNTIFPEMLCADPVGHKGICRTARRNHLREQQSFLSGRTIELVEARGVSFNLLSYSRHAKAAKRRTMSGPCHVWAPLGTQPPPRLPPVRECTSETARTLIVPVNPITAGTNVSNPNRQSGVNWWKEATDLTARVPTRRR